MDEMELPGWSIEVTEQSPGVWRLAARHDNGWSFQTADSDIDRAFQQLKDFDVASEGATVWRMPSLRGPHHCVARSGVSPPTVDSTKPDQDVLESRAGNEDSRGSQADESRDMEMWARLDELVAKVGWAREPYGLGLQVMSCAIDAAAESGDASRVYELWGGLTDRYELRPGDRGHTEDLMRIAASEWSAVRNGDEPVHTYLERWLPPSD